MGAGEEAAVRAEAHAGDIVGVPPKGEQLLPRLRIPYLHRLVPGGGGEAAAVGAEADGVTEKPRVTPEAQVIPDLFAMLPEGELLLARLRVPHLYLSL
jgi:hypothetical protein